MLDDLNLVLSSVYRCLLHPDLVAGRREPLSLQEWHRPARIISLDVCGDNCVRDLGTSLRRFDDVDTSC